MQLFLSPDIQQEWMERWTGNLELNGDLHLPAENKFICGWINLTFVLHDRQKKKRVGCFGPKLLQVSGKCPIRWSWEKAMLRQFDFCSPFIRPAKTAIGYIDQTWRKSDGWMCAAICNTLFVTYVMKVSYLVLRFLNAKLGLFLERRRSDFKMICADGWL